MKSYANLYDIFISEDNIRRAIHDSLKGRHNKRAVQRFMAQFESEEQAIAHFQKIGSNYRNAPHTPRYIYDGIDKKKRTIIVPRFWEIVIQHMAIQAMQPILERGMYYHSYAAIPGRGTHKGKRHIEKWIREDARNCKYILKLDIRKFFDSIPHDVLMRELRAHIRDRRFLAILEEIISVTEIGLPLGFYTSQWLSNWYLQGLDHFIKEELHAAHYMRYMDDIVVFGANKRKLHRTLEAIREYLAGIGLEVKGNWQVFRFDYIDRHGARRGRDLDFMGFRFFRDKTTLRKSILRKMKRKARKIGKSKAVSIYEARQMLSYLGWIKATATYKTFRETIKPYVTFRRLRQKVSAYDRKHNKQKEAA